MKERQTSIGDNYQALTEATKFTPTCPYIDEKKLVAYTLPFQEIALPFMDKHGQLIANLQLLALFIPYSVTKSYMERPPLIHMAALIGDVPLLEKAVDVDNRGEIWKFNVFAGYPVRSFSRTSTQYPSH